MAGYPRVTLLFAIALGGVIVVGAAGACSDNEATCKVDTDCPVGDICRDGQCGIVNADASPSDDGPTTNQTCADENAPCAVPTDCCSSVCVNNVCLSAAPPPQSTACKTSLELCQNDCCDGFTCTNGVCR